MGDIAAVLLDLGHTLTSYDVDEEGLHGSLLELLADPAQMGQLGDGVTGELMLRARTTAANLINASYAREELREQDIVAVFREALHKLGVYLDEPALLRVVELQHEAVSRNLCTPPQTLEALRALKGNGYLLGLVSNATFWPHLMKQDLRRLGVSPYIDSVGFSSEIGWRKPHPEIYGHVLRELGVEPQRALFVGDRVKEDVSGPKRLGMRAVLTREYRQEPFDSVAPDATIERFPELLDCLDRLRQLR